MSTNFKEFYVSVLNTNIEFVEESWKKWIEYNRDNLKKEVNKNFPNGFKDFLIKDFEDIKNSLN